MTLNQRIWMLENFAFEKQVEIFNKFRDLHKQLNKDKIKKEVFFDEMEKITVSSQEAIEKKKKKLEIKAIILWDFDDNVQFVSSFRNAIIKTFELTLKKRSQSNVWHVKRIVPFLFIPLEINDEKVFREVKSEKFKFYLDELRDFSNKCKKKTGTH